MMRVTMADVSNVIKMVLLDNKGNTLTEALCIGIEQSIVGYVQNIEAAMANPNDKEPQNG